MLSFPLPKKADQVKSNMKTMLICFFFDVSLFRSSRQFSRLFTWTLFQKLRRKRPDLWWPLFLTLPCPVRPFFVSSNKKRHERKPFADVAEVKQKTTEALSNIMN